MAEEWRQKKEARRHDNMIACSEKGPHVVYTRKAQGSCRRGAAIGPDRLLAALLYTSIVQRAVGLEAGMAQSEEAVEVIKA
jgi:hypothetical protein